MDLKLIDDLAALALWGSYTRAAEARHVTHPAFGRRIRALEAWAGVPLVTAGRAPVRLTAAGQALLDEAQPVSAALGRLRSRWQAQARGHNEPDVATVRVGAGRTLARTMVPEWLARHRALLRPHRVALHTSSMAEIGAAFERGEVDLLVCYEHPALSIGLSPQRFRHLTLASDRLVPVARADASGRVRHALGGARWIDYAPTLALGRLLQDHLGRQAPTVPATVVCDSPDAMLELAVRDLGLAWLPASLAEPAIRSGVLRRLGGRADQVHFEVRMYRPRARQSPLLEALWAATAR